MAETALQLDARDNVIVALATLEPGTVARYGPADASASCAVAQTIPAKQKMALKALQARRSHRHVRHGRGRSD